MSKRKDYTPNLVIKQFNELFYMAATKDLKKRGYRNLGEGSSRVVYKRGKTVIKVPYNDQGFADNITEAYAYRVYRNGPDDNGIIFAPCRLLPTGCLMMVFVNEKAIEYSSPDFPDWAKWIDGSQVGLFKGRIVAYDSAYDICDKNVSAGRWAKVILPETDGMGNYND